MHIGRVLSLWLTLFMGVDSQNLSIEPKIVGGDYTTIKQYPHSGLLEIQCVITKASSSNWICGSSIINQQVILTAAHCFDGCSQPESKIVLNYGHEHRTKAFKTFVEEYKIHERFSLTDIVEADIALGKLKTPLRLDANVQRVALVRNPPLDGMASIAGWGIIDEEKGTGTRVMKHLQHLKLWSKRECIKVLGSIPNGCICAGYKKSNDYVSAGDSGSALVINNYIQVGVVSFKTPAITRSLVVYTDVRYYYDWIIDNTYRLMCRRDPPSFTTQRTSTNWAKINKNRDNHYG